MRGLNVEQLAIKKSSFVAKELGADCVLFFGDGVITAAIHLRGLTHKFTGAGAEGIVSVDGHVQCTVRHCTRLKVLEWWQAKTT